MVVVPPETATSVILGVAADSKFIPSLLETDEEAIGVNIISKEHREL